MNRYFALISDGDVFEVIRISENTPIAERYYAGLSSDPNFIECTGYNVTPGYFYDNGNFYSNIDLEKNNPLSKNDEDDNLNKIYAFIKDGDIFGTMTVLKTDNAFDMIVAGMSSNPKCIESTSNLSVDIGWTWDGQKFNPPL